RRSIDDAPAFAQAVKVYAPAFVTGKTGVAGGGGVTVVGPGAGITASSPDGTFQTFTLNVPPGAVPVPVPGKQIVVLPPEAGYGPVAGTIIDKPVTLDGKPVTQVISDYTKKVRHHTLTGLVGDSALALGGMSVLSVLLG